MMSFKLAFLSLFCVSEVLVTLTSAHLVVPNVDAAVVATPTTNLPSQTAVIDLRAQQTDFPFDLSSALPSIPYTTAQTTVPQSCQDYGVPTSTSAAECPVGNTMSAMSITFADCGSTFTMCRCENSSSMSYDDALANFAKVPTGLRRFVETVLLVPDSVPHAYTLTTGDIHMFSNTALDTWIHEATHALDYANPATPLSASEGWLSAVAADSCVPDTYSQTNAIEDLAQIGVLKVYALANGGQLPPNFDNVCMKNQLAFVDSLPQFNATTLFGNTCDIDASAEIGGVTTGNGAKHITPPVNLENNIASPFPNSNTTASPSGFRKVPISSSGTDPAVSAGNDPSKQKSAATQIPSQKGSFAIGGAVFSILAILNL